MNIENPTQRSKRILGQLSNTYPDRKAYDLDGRGQHFVCEVEPTNEHPDYDRAVEVILSSRPHKHLKMTQRYTIISGTLRLHAGDEIITLYKGDTYIMKPNNIHWAESDDESWVEIYSEPGWTQEDHIVV